ncbi:MAG: hypothetical protein ACJ8CR_39650 [Roseiflexaceae bacterium]
MAPINFNGQEYDSPDAMPPDVRRLYELANQMLADQDGDGVPDLFGQVAGTSQANVIQTTQFVVDGKVYTSLDELPAEARQKYEQALGQWDANRNGVPDMLEGGLFGATTQATATPPAQPAPMPLPTLVSSDSLPLGARLLIAGLAVLLLIAVAAIVLMNR